MRLLAIFILPFLFSCSLFVGEKTEASIARVGEIYLYDSDVEGIVPAETPFEDSVLIVNNYVHGWIKDNLILQKAELNLPDDQKNVEKQLADYRKSLIIYTYEKELIKQRLDTSVSLSEIQAFYDQNDHFELKDDIVKVRYLKVNKKAPQIKRIRKLYTTNKEEEIEGLKELAYQFCEKFHLNEHQWIRFDDIKTEVPIDVAQTNEYLKNVKNVELEDSLSFYFVYFKEYKLINDVSPLSFEAQNIKNIIINKRKLSLINKIRSELYQEAFMSKNIEIYEDRNNEK